MTDRTTAQIAAVNIESGSVDAFGAVIQESANAGFEWAQKALQGEIEDQPDIDLETVLRKGIRAQNQYTLSQAAALVEGLDFQSNSPEFNRGVTWAQREIIRLLRSVANAPLPEIR